MNKFTIAGVLVVLAIVGISALSFVSSSPAEAGEYDEFAQCIADSGATFYGAFWCGACNQQKTLFGASAEHLPYTECSLPNRSMSSVCQDANLEVFPTWEFGDGSRITGTRSMLELAERTGCTLSEDEASTPTEEELSPIDTTTPETQEATSSPTEIQEEFSGTSTPPTATTTPLP